MSRAVSIAVYVLSFLCCGSLSAQTDSSPVTGATPPALAPGTPDISYALSDLESINNYNGHLSFHVPLLRVGGRGEAGYTMYATIEKTWYVDTTDYGGGYYSYAPLDAYWNSIDAGYGPGVLFYRTAEQIGPNQCSQSVDPTGVSATLTRLTMRYPDHTEEELIDRLTNGKSKTPSTCAVEPNDTQTSNGTIFVSHSGESDVFVADSTIYDLGAKSDGTLVQKNGLRYRIESELVKSITDRNGNQVQFSYDIYSRVTQITDAANRVITITYRPSNTGCDTISYPGANGATRQIQACYEQNYPSADNVPTLSSLFPYAGVSDASYNPTVLRRIILADQSQYQFSYNSYGELIRVDLPTGGAYEYEHGSGDPSQSASGIMGSYTQPFIYRRVTKRTVYSSSSTVESVRTYWPSYAPLQMDNVDLGSEVVTEQTADGSGNPVAATNHYFYGAPNTYLHYFPDPISYAPWREGLEYQTAQYDASGNTVLRSVSNTWQQRPCASDEVCPVAEGYQTGPQPNDPSLAQVDTLLADSGQVSRRSFNYDRYNNETDRYEYDWGSGGPGTLLRHTFRAYNTNSQYFDPHVNLVGLLYYGKVYDGNGNLIANWDQEYDETPVTDESAITGHDGAYGTGFNARGNVTTARQWLDTSGQFLATKYTYDIAGNVLTATDPLSHITTYGYWDSQNTYAHVTSNVNALGLSTAAGYDYNTGKMVESTDANGVNTTYSYNDPLDRLTQVSRAAGGGQTNYQYSAGGVVPVTRIDCQDQNTIGDCGHGRRTVWDGLGRVSEFDTYETSLQYIATFTSYDALGRVSTVSNPARPSDSLQYTTYGYDGLGRVTSVTTPDGASTVTSYSGNQSTVADPARAQKTYTYDPIGRLTSVVEDSTSGGLNYVTSYSYDALDNLTTVTQGSQTRSFTYDSLKRLTKAVNPESGTTMYAYDNAGNLSSKTDARNITITYSYDALNRLQQKNYSDGTPRVQYIYDDPNVAYAKGRLTQVHSPVSTTSILSYDALGRVTSSQQNTASFLYNFNYGYDLSGALTSEQYPSGRIVNTSYDGAGRPNTVNTSGGGTYVSGVDYEPNGAYTALHLGNGMVSRYWYNNRLQPTTMRMAHNDDPGDVRLQLDFGWGSTNDNGNLQWITMHNGGPTYPQFLPFTQVFYYDKLNRLISATDTGGWSRSFRYDQYGNMAVDNATGIAANQAPTPGSIDPATNRIPGNFDPAGNQAIYGSYTVAYDAENRQVSIADSYPNGAGKVLYFYDGNGQRVDKNYTTVYVYDIFGHLAAEYSTQANPSPCSTCYLEWDHLGSARLITDASGTTISRHDYLPFGEEIAANTAGRLSEWGPGADGINQKFTGKERDSETGLDFFQARYYGAALGRFTSPDPDTNLATHLSDPQGWNAYAYGRNNPLIYTDPTGESYQICDANGQNCAQQQLSDQEFENEKQAAQANGEYFNNGTAYHYDSSGNRVNDATYQQTDVDLSPFASQTLSQAGNRAAPFVNAAGAGLMVFGSLVAPVPMALAQCAAGNCDKGGLAMAVIPELGALREGATLLRAGRGVHAAEILDKTGGFEQALKDFDTLPGAETIRGEVRVKMLSDGTTVNVRDFSSHGDRPTLEIIHPSGERTKYRY